MARAQDRPVPYPKIMYGVAGILSRKEANFLYNTPVRLGAGFYADLGTYHGRSALLVAGGMQDNNIDGHVITVDSYDGRTLDTFKSHPQSSDIVRATFKEKGVGHYITAIQGITADVAVDYQDKEFEFVFIDADHSYEGCKVDFEAWSPLVKSGGEIAFHDRNDVGVAQVLEEIEWERCHIVARIEVLKKP